MTEAGAPLRPGNCGDCGAAVETARQTYCRACAAARRRTSNAEADRRRRQADRDRRRRPPAVTSDGDVVLPPEAVRLLALQVAALREAVEPWVRNQRLQSLLNDPPEGHPAAELSAARLGEMITFAEDQERHLGEAAARAAGGFLAAVDNLLPGQALGR